MATRFRSRQFQRLDLGEPWRSVSWVVGTGSKVRLRRGLLSHTMEAG